MDCRPINIRFMFIALISAGKTLASKLSMAILGISLYNAILSKQHSAQMRGFYLSFSCYSALFRNSIRFSF